MNETRLDVQMDIWVLEKEKCNPILILTSNKCWFVKYSRNTKTILVPKPHKVFSGSGFERPQFAGWWGIAHGVSLWLHYQINVKMISLRSWKTTGLSLTKHIDSPKPENYRQRQTSLFFFLQYTKAIASHKWTRKSICKLRKNWLHFQLNKLFIIS